MGLGNGTAVVEAAAASAPELEAARRDINRHEESIRELYGLARDASSSMSKMAAGIARIEGRLDGAMRAKKVSGTVLGIVVSIGIAGAGAIGVLLLELIKKGS